MAQSPSHKFGQIIGELLEHVLDEQLLETCVSRGLYLDMVGKDRPARPTKKLSWHDAHGNKHDLDFVIERNGSQTRIGDPVAFIESAWRRYTKHSKNKAQEIQGAVLPIAEHYSEFKPFLGVILAGEYTDPSLNQLRSNGFEVLHISYKVIQRAFAEVGVDALFGEDTPTSELNLKVSAMESLREEEYSHIIGSLREFASAEITAFMTALGNCLDRQVVNVSICPMFGRTTSCDNLDLAKNWLNEFSEEEQVQGVEFQKFEIIIRYSNGDRIQGEFTNCNSALDFLERLG